MTEFKKTRKKLLNSLALRLSKSTQLTLLAAEHIPESEFNCLLSMYLVHISFNLLQSLQRIRSYVIKPEFSRIFWSFPIYLLSKKLKTKGSDDFYNRCLRL